MNEEALHQEVMRAQKAKDILDNDLFSEAFDAIRKRCIDTWASSPMGDTRGHDELHKTVKILDRVQRFFVDCVNNGKVTEETLAYIAATRDLERINGSR